MAQKTVVQLIDDLTGEQITDGKGETVTFSLDGRTYEIDLSDKNAEKFRSLFSDYVAVATKVGRKSTKRRTQTGPSASEIRQWAKDQGYDVPDRGRIPAEIREAYQER